MSFLLLSPDEKIVMESLLHTRVGFRYVANELVVLSVSFSLHSNIKSNKNAFQ